MDQTNGDNKDSLIKGLIVKAECCCSFNLIFQSRDHDIT